MNLATVLVARAEEAPDSVGLIYEDHRKFTFRELDELSGKSGNFIRSLGVAAGSRVGVMLPNTPELFVILFGIWRIGVSAATINTMYQVKELEHAIKTSGIDILFITPDQLHKIDEVKGLLKAVVVVGEKEQSRKDIVYWDEGISSASADCPIRQPGADDEACILFTSGSTGVPKAVITTHSGWLKTLDVLTYGSTGRPGPYPFQAGKAPNIVTFPLVHSGGQQATLFTMLVGRTVLLMRKFQVDKYVELVEKYRIDNMVLMPPMIHDLVHYDKPVDFSSVNSLFAVGQEFPQELKKAFEQKFKVPVLYNYGSTEAGHVAGWNMKDVKAGKWKPGSLGKIYKGVQVEIRDENDKPLPAGNQGEIVVKSDVTVKGYTEQKEGADKLIKDGWLYTGDLGYLDEDNVLFYGTKARDDQGWRLPGQSGRTG